mmetsp:Transcript_26230/g.60644  ORF Transcript_26230/g.60644 Transcript_26230/m.60644 type:complete len:210 (-) Transcript_26230:263-892(-)
MHGDAQGAVNDTGAHARAGRDRRGREAIDSEARGCARDRRQPPRRALACSRDSDPLQHGHVEPELLVGRSHRAPGRGLRQRGQVGHAARGEHDVETVRADRGQSGVQRGALGDDGCREQEGGEARVLVPVEGAQQLLDRSKLLLRAHRQRLVAERDEQRVHGVPQQPGAAAGVEPEREQHELGARGVHRELPAEERAVPPARSAQQCVD